MLTRDASLARKCLNGVACLYKPAKCTMGAVRAVLLKKLCDDLNSMECREPRKYVHISGKTTEPLHVAVEPNYADHPLIAGPRYLPSEMKVRAVKQLEFIMSGVCVIGINDGIRDAFKLMEYNSPSTYHIVGELGKCTNNALVDGRMIYKYNYEYITKTGIDRAVSATQAVHQKNLLHACGYDPRSQEAYEVLSSGLVRPTNKQMPLCYSIKCIDMNLPYFTVELVTANESVDYLLSIITSIGMRLKNMSVTVSIRCLRHAFFTIEDTLLQKHWQLQYVLDNMKHCQEKMNKNKDFGTFLKMFEDEEKQVIQDDVNDMDGDLHDELQQ